MKFLLAILFIITILSPVAQLAPENLGSAYGQSNQTKDQETKHMKTAISASSPDEGSNVGHGSTPLPAAMQKGQAAAAASNNLHYGDGSTYGSGGHYAVGDPVPPVSDGGRVRMDLAARNNENLQGYVGNHITQMTGNPYFLLPDPPAPAFLTLFETFQSALAAAMSAKTVYDDALSARDAARAALVDGMNTRGAYVQASSKGNSNVIISSGLNVRNPRTPVGQLPPPVDLKAELNGTAGVMKLQWKAVPYARGYIVQCSLDVMPRVFTPLANTTKPRAEKPLVLGETYVFRVAAFGGSTGQSYFSPEVIRGAA